MNVLIGTTVALLLEWFPNSRITVSRSGDDTHLIFVDGNIIHHVIPKHVVTSFDVEERMGRHLAEHLSSMMKARTNDR